MSLYNIIFGMNPLTEKYLNAIGLKKDDIPRLRDTCLIKYKDNICLYVYARCGKGGSITICNRGIYNNKYYKTDYLSKLDETFRIIIFNLPHGFSFKNEEIKNNDDLPELCNKNTEKYIQSNQSIKLRAEKFYEKFNYVVKELEVGYDSFENEYGKVIFFKDLNGNIEMIDADFE